MSDEKGNLINEAGEVVGEVVRKASPLSIGMAIVMAVGFLGVGGIVYFNRDTIIKFAEVAHDVKHLQQAHDQCHTEMAALKSEVASLRSEVATLKRNL